MRFCEIDDRTLRKSIVQYINGADDVKGKVGGGRVR